MSFFHLVTPSCHIYSQVIRTHPDYSEMNPPRLGVNTVPTFRILQSQPSTVVLVLDTSGSMGGPRIQKLSQVNMGSAVMRHYNHMVLDTSGSMGGPRIQKLSQVILGQL